MNAIERIHLEDGPEDGRELTAAMLKPLIAGNVAHLEEICLYADSAESRLMPYLLGRYRLRRVREGTATYRWHPA